MPTVIPERRSGPVQTLIDLADLLQGWGFPEARARAVAFRAVFPGAGDVSRDFSIYGVRREEEKYKFRNLSQEEVDDLLDSLAVAYADSKLRKSEHVVPQATMDAILRGDVGEKTPRVPEQDEVDALLSGLHGNPYPYGNE